jgi:AraC-like DNA-binding protein
VSLSDEPPVVFTNAYKGAAEGASYDYWREEICRSICDMEINPTRDGVVDMETRIAGLAPVTIAVATGTSAAIGRTPQMARDGSDDFTFVCRTHSTMPFRQGDRILEVGQSEVVLGDLTQSSYGNLGDCRQFTALIIERKALLGLSPGAEDLMFRQLKIGDELDDMIGRYADLASRTASHVDAHGRFLMGQHLVDLIALALGTRFDAAELAQDRGQAQARLALMKADILANLGRADLNLASIARRYHLSQRQAQRLFERNGSTFTEFLLEQRLLLACKGLLNSSNDHRKVSDIAHSAGFSDLSYFNRAFRRRFGMTPSDKRENRS